MTSTNHKNIEDAYPLSPGQAGLLFHSLYAPESGVYVTQVACTLGNLNVTTLEEAWQQVIARHPILRTAFVWKDLKNPLQVVGRQVDLPLCQEDWRHLSADMQEAHFQEYLLADRQRGFVLSKAPLMRLALMRVGNQAYKLLWSHHHILLDGWSVHQLISEVFTLYAAIQAGQRVQLPPSRPYKEYIAWLQKQNTDIAERFWQETLAGLEEPTELGIPEASRNAAAPLHDAANEPSVGSNYGEARSTLSLDTSEALRRMAREYKLTLNTIFQGGLALLLSRYSSADDVLFGSVVSGRPPALVGVESMVGLFVNSLPVRVQLSGNPTVITWLQQLQTQLVEMRNVEYSPLVDVHGWSEIPREQALFGCLFAFENYPVDAPEMDESGGGLTVNDYQVVEQVNYPLTITAGGGDELSLKVLYDCNRFDAATVQTLLVHWQTLLESMVVEPEQRLNSVTMLTDSEQEEQLATWNDTSTDYPKERPIHELFAEQAAATPDAVAVTFESGSQTSISFNPSIADISRERSKHEPENHPVTLTYRQLDEQANQLAHYLQSLGVGSETFVGICMERSTDIIVGILGILKAGGTYIPLDPTYPPERLSVMIEDAQPKAILCLSNTHATLVAATRELVNQKSKIVNLSTNAEIAEFPTTNPQTTVMGEHLAYVMYTSGSTGKPKGITIPHRAISRLVFNTNFVDFGPDLRMGMISNTAFDAATFELWGALLHGATLIGVPKEVALSPAGFGNYIRQQGIDTMFLTAALFNQMAREAPDAFGTMRHLLVGGEALDPKWIRSVLKSNPPTRLQNGYGPTESTTFATWYHIDDLAEDATNVPIGYPIANTQTYILDRHMRPVPAGVLGELYIGGDGLARGYLNRSQLTAEKFVPNPFSQEKGARLYKTGDLVRYGGDGAIEFVGRVDHQIKLRGFRIELAEIEAVLSQHPKIQAAVVVVDDGADLKRIVAYILPDLEQATTIQELRIFLQQKLPEYMIPALFVSLDALPLNANGKLDRKALPLPEQAGLTVGESAAMGSQALTPTEEIIAGIWAKVLNVSRVGAADSFFNLGGHSLLATQVISRLREAFGVEIPLRDLFEAATLAGLATRVEMMLQSAQGLHAPAIEPVDRNQHLPLSFGQQRLWFMDQLSPGGSAYNFHAALRLAGRLDVNAMELALNEIVRRHEVLRTTFDLIDGQPTQRIHPAARLAIPVIDLRPMDAETRQAELREQINAEARGSFDLSKGPLLRVTLVQLSDEEHAVVVVKHHIITDGWAMGIFVREFAALYAIYAKDELSVLPELPIQYADFATWQRGWMAGDVLENHLAYWRRQLADLPRLNLPTDLPRPVEQTFRGERISRLLSAELSDGLRKLSGHEGATLFMTLLAAFKILLAHAANQEDIVVGADIANRNRAETEGLIGFFANQLVLRTDLTGNPTFQELLGRVRSMALGAYAHQDLPFEKLVETLAPKRDSSRNPLFQVMFILQNAPVSRLDLPELTVSPLEVEQETTAFDITLSIIEDAASEDATASQIRLTCRYYRDIFEPDTMARMLRNLEQLLGAIVDQPDARLHDLTRALAPFTQPRLAKIDMSLKPTGTTNPSKKESAMKTKQGKPSKFDSLMKVKAKSVSVSQSNLVETRAIEPGQMLPLVMQPTEGSLDLGDWASSHKASIDQELAKHGAILFRGFSVESISDFEEFTRILAPELMDYSERSSPRSKVSGSIFTSTDHPADQPIVLHNEQSYTLNWMMKLWFYCAREPTTGGRTPIADVRKVYRRLSRETVAKFEAKQWMYMRNYGVGMGLPWQQAFQTEDRAAVEAHCSNSNIEFEWLDEGADGERLRTRQVRPAIRQHPTTGETVWFNHALFFHISSLEPTTRESLTSGLAEEDLPFNTYYGDGSPIEPKVVDEIRSAFEAETVSFAWQQGDVLMMDNMLVAHGRDPFSGPRKIVVAMAEPFVGVGEAVRVSG